MEGVRGKVFDMSYAMFIWKKVVGIGAEVGADLGEHSILNAVQAMILWQEEGAVRGEVSGAGGVQSFILWWAMYRICSYDKKGVELLGRCYMRRRGVFNASASNVSGTILIWQDGVG